MQISKIKMALVATLLCSGINLTFGQNTAKEQEARLIAVLKSNAENTQKSDACRELARIATADAVPALAALLSDEKLSHMARYGLETIPSPAVDEVLRDALGKFKGRLLVGVIGSIGVRHDEKAVKTLSGFLKDPDADVVQVSARALGMIGTADAARKLESLLPGVSATNQLAVCEGLLRCAEALKAKGENRKAIAVYDSLRNLKQAPHQVKTAAWRGAIMAREKDGLPLLLQVLRSTEPGMATAGLRIAIEMKDAGVSKALAGELGKVPADMQIKLCSVLGKRGDASSIQALLGLAKTGEKAGRLAAIRAAAEIGNAGATEGLISLLKDPDGEVAQAAYAGLAGLPGEDVDEIIIKTLDSPDRAIKLKMIEIAGQRRIEKAIPCLKSMMEDKDEALRAAVMQSYANFAGEAELPDLLEKIVKSTNTAEIGAIEKALCSVCLVARDSNALAGKLVDALNRSVPEAKPALLRSLRAAGGSDALKAVRGAVNDQNNDVHTSAIRVISEWKTGDAVPVLLDLAKNSTGQVDRVLSMRGYLGMATRKEIPAKDRLAICTESATMIKSDEEKRMLLGALGSLANAESLKLTVSYLDDTAVKREAVSTVMAIAEKRAKKQHTGMARDALEKVVQVVKDNPAAVKRAKELLKQMEKEK